MANEETQASWEKAAAGWVQNERTFDAAFNPFTHALLAAADLQPGQRVLDVGCGAGTLLEAATGVGAHAVGVDISVPMVDAARRRCPDAAVHVADAQTEDLCSLAPGDPFERVISRFGVMFFADPVRAFANIRSATAVAGTLTFVCWRAEEKDMFFAGIGPLLAKMDDPAVLAPPGMPGPLGLADSTSTRSILRDAGWADIAIEPLDGLCDFGIDGSTGVEERLAAALSGGLGRGARAELEPRLGPDGWEALLDEARSELRSGLVDGSVRFIGHTWLVTAKNAS